MTQFSRKSSGFSLIEILLVLVVVAVLATLALPAYGYLLQKARMAVCIANLRTLHLGLNSYLQDNQTIWPQMDEAFSAEAPERDIFLWWEKILEPYGVPRKSWVCPTVASISERDDFSGSYSVTQFDEYPGTAYRWKQPWVVEREGSHGLKSGPMLLMSDGTVLEALGMMPNQ